MAAFSCCELSWSDDFRNAGKLGRVEPARIRIGDDAKPLKPTYEKSDLGTPPAESTESPVAENSPATRAAIPDQTNAWRLRWRQPQSTATPVPSRPTTVRAPSASRAVLVWTDSEQVVSSHVRQVAQFAPADPFNDPFGDDPREAKRDSAEIDTTEISQAGQSTQGGGLKPAAPGGQAEALDSSQFGTQPPPSESRLVPGGNRQLPKSTLPTPNTKSPFPADDRPQPAEDRPTLDPDATKPMQPDAPPPATDIPPKTPNLSPDLSDPAPQPMESTEPPSEDMPAKPDGTNGEKTPPCDRIYNRRNCCTENGKCTNAREKIRAYTISKIHLDISPIFTNTDQEMTTEEIMLKTLADAPARRWMDRQGQELAHGRIQDFRNGRIHVLTDSGEVVKLPFHSLSDDDLCFFTAWWSIPTECPLGDEQFVPRNWLCSTLNWKASALCHKPLYFEEVALERYGHTTGPFTQPFVSTAHFFGSLVSLPYQMGIHPPQECIYALGYYRPGNCAPWLVPPFPVSARGAMLEAAAIAGGVYLIP